MYCYTSNVYFPFLTTLLQTRLLQTRVLVWGAAQPQQQQYFYGQIFELAVCSEVGSKVVNILQVVGNPSHDQCGRRSVIVVTWNNEQCSKPQTGRQYINSVPQLVCYIDGVLPSLISAKYVVHAYSMQGGGHGNLCHTM